MLPNVRTSVARWFRGPLSAWYHPDYRLPFATLEARTGMEPRRADFVAWNLISSGALKARALRSPPLVSWEELARVHTDELLGQLGDGVFLARVFAADPAELSVDEVVRTVRLACGGTLEAARFALAERRPALNLLGGFHHAGPTSAGGSCLVNDVAVAIAALRAEGFDGQVVVLDLDAHPPDGTAACLANDRAAWIGSLSGAEWVPLPGVDETLLPAGAPDAVYLEALDGLLSRLPRSALVFVLAGGDVLAGDRLGRLRLTLAGALERDARVLRAVEGTPSVWLPAGGYHPDAWRLFASTAQLLATGRQDPVPAGPDPLRGQFARIAAQLDPRKLGGDDELFTAADLDALLGGRVTEPRMLGRYTTAGVEYALHKYGLLTQLGRLGYGKFRVALDQGEVGDRMRVYGTAGGLEHLLVETVLSRDRVDGRAVLFVHWLTLRNPRALFSSARPRLRGQEVPGLGLARDAGELLARIAARLGLEGVAFRPMHLHAAWTARHAFAFADVARQGRFLALVRDGHGHSLPELDAALEEGRVRLDGAPYRWEPDVMVAWLTPRPDAAAEATRLASTHRYVIVRDEARLPA